jgi:hypothetical protein
LFTFICSLYFGVCDHDPFTLPPPTFNEG